MHKNLLKVKTGNSRRYVKILLFLTYDNDTGKKGVYL